ncbi:MAG: phospho-sugar mutase [Clostridia bacterium]|nr:phospho-sugar mutase [Clostridia bacterium]
MEEYLKQYERWLASDKVSAAEKAELASIKDNDDEIRLRFSNYLSFGTAGLRGVMKPGMNAMNVNTVAYATQALAALIIREGRAQDGVVIAYDCRINSRLFAETAASVLAANHIPVYMFDELRPTPELSFALRELQCVAGINITASHNPKQYNGYKAYWDDGAQLPPEHADVVAGVMASLDIFADVKTMDFGIALSTGKVKLLGRDMDELYLKQVEKQAVNPRAVRDVADKLKIVYSPLHGTGYRLVPEILRRIGLRMLYTVPEQMVIDGRFPTVEKPNPEYRQAFDIGMKIADEVGSDLVIATDPDADRVGVVTRTADGDFITITGNQMGALLLDYILTAYEETGTMPEVPFAVKTIVTTELAAKVCRAHGVTMHNVLTGFKFIGEVIKNYEAKGYGTFVLGFEESYGYLKGTYARDKDAVVAAMLICEMTAYYKGRGMTLSDALNALYAKYGYCYEANVEIYMEGLDGPARMAAKMDSLRAPAPTEIAGQKVVRFGDYQAQTLTDCTTGASEPTNLPASNVLSFTLENGDVIVARPSGTEPKIKFYFMLSGVDRADTEAKMKAYRESLGV